MATLLGRNDMKQFAVPLGWDATELAKYRLADGTTYDQVTNDIIEGLQVVNGQLLSDPLYGSLLSTTEELTMEYRDGTGAGGMNERTEYARPDPRRAGTIGHMLPLRAYDRALGWTWDFLQNARQIQIDSDISAALQDVKDNFQRRLLMRFFSNTENLIGTAGYDEPFVFGSGGTIKYTPPAYNGKAFASSHTHFDRKADYAAALEAGAGHLFEHGLMGPYRAIVPAVDAATIKGLTGYIKPDRGVDYIRTDTGAVGQLRMGDEQYIGAFETSYGIVWLWANPRLPTATLGMYKAFGNGDQRNPLAVRYNPRFGVGAFLLRGEMLREFPLENAIIMHEFGVGVGSRLNGYAATIAGSGDYVVPTIS